MSDLPEYGLWSVVIINSLIFILFALSFTRPRTSQDWRSLGAFSAFIVALFAEMYGFRYARSTPAFLPRFGSSVRRNEA